MILAANLYKLLIHSYLMVENYSLQDKISSLREDVFRFIRKRYRYSTSDSDDLTQDVMVKALRLSDTFDSSRSDLGTWLCNIATTSSIDRYRRSARRKKILSSLANEEYKRQTEGTSDQYNAENLEKTREDQDSLIGLMAHLPEDRRELVIRRHLLDQSHKYIANACNLPLGTVKSRLYFAIKELSELRLAS